jgi:hypothetical protein
MIVGRERDKQDPRITVYLLSDGRCVVAIEGGRK